jgi:cytochrome c biogenesis protein CcmG, thiol:disulfide interchange protein DsbE
MPRRITTTVIVLAICLCAARAAPALAEPAPDFLLKDIDGVSHSLANYRGQVLLLNFWATWCVPCKREAPSLVRLHDLGNPGLAILGIALSDAEPNVRAFVDQQNIAYPVALDHDDPDDAVAALYGVDSIPTNVIINGDGELHAVYVGFLTVAHFEASVLRDLAEILPREVEPRGKAAVTWAAMKSR